MKCIALWWWTTARRTTTITPSLVWKNVANACCYRLIWKPKDTAGRSSIAMILVQRGFENQWLGNMRGPKPEAWKAESGGWVLGEGAASSGRPNSFLHFIDARWLFLASQCRQNAWALAFRLACFYIAINLFIFIYLFIYLKSATEGPEGHLYCRKNTETHKMT